MNHMHGEDRISVFFFFFFKGKGNLLCPSFVHVPFQLSFLDEGVGVVIRSENWVVGVGRTKLINHKAWERECDWVILPLLLPTPTISDGVVN